MSVPAGHVELERTVASIIVGARHRTDLGDLTPLVASIAERGLLQPITVTLEGYLVCGARRLAAVRVLGWRTVNVWVRSGISERLEQLLAEQDENALHKPLNQIEAAALYREVKALLAEDAARRQEATRFGVDDPNEAGAPDGADGAARRGGGVGGAAGFGAAYGPGDSPGPASLGEARAQAARLVTGRDAHQVLERISRLEALAADEHQPVAVRERATEEVARIRDGAKVLPSHLRVNTELSLAELDRIAADPAQPSPVREQATRDAARVRAARESDVKAAELEALAKAALARIKTGTAGKSTAPAVERGPVQLPTSVFTHLWDDMAGWASDYDPAVIAAELSEDRWRRFQQTVSETIAFTDTVRTLRTTSPTPVPA